MADAFDRPRFAARLRTRALGRRARIVARTGSANDDAWEALRSDGHGATVIALAQTNGRGREGRSWSQVEGRGLALSVALLRGSLRPGGVIPLAAGLAAAHAAHACGVADARLKWPNDVLVGGRKLAGVLCEARRTAEGEAVVIGIGMNVRHAWAEFPPELRGSATSLALAGSTASIEDAAAAFLNAGEALWDRLDSGQAGAVLREWTAACTHWGEWLRVRTPAGPVEGAALRLDDDGALVLRNAAREIRVLAGDVVHVLPADVRP